MPSKPVASRIIHGAGCPSALRLAARARLFIATDTGLTTIRELLGRPSIYASMNTGIATSLMRYGYLRRMPVPAAFVAYDAETCLRGVDRLVLEC
jgi:hypothetical protein